jgi:hypothetical protein
LFGRRNVNQLDGFGDFDAGGDGNERAISKKGLVERGEGIVRSPGVFAEVLFDENGILHQRGGKAFNPCAAGNRLEARKFLRKKSVHKNEAIAGQFGKHGFVQNFAFHAVDGGCAGGLKRQTGNGRDVGEPPVFVAQGGKTEFGEARDAGVAQGRKPLGLPRAGIRLPERFNNPRFAGIFSLRHHFYFKRNGNLFMQWAVAQMKFGREFSHRWTQSVALISDKGF